MSDQRQSVDDQDALGSPMPLDGKGSRRRARWFRAGPPERTQGVNGNEAAAGGAPDMVHDPGALVGRIGELEAELAERDKQPPDLSRLSEGELGVLASEAAATILRTAQRECLEKTEAANQQLAEARSEAEEIVSTARLNATQTKEAARRQAAEAQETSVQQAQALTERSQAEAAAMLEAARVEATTTLESANSEATATLESAREEAAATLQAARDEADSTLGSAIEESQALRQSAAEEAQRRQQEIAALASKTVAETKVESDRLRMSAESQASATLAKAKAEGEEIVAGAIQRRDALFNDLDHQKKLMMSVLDDAASIQQAFVEGYGRLRKTLDESVAHLVGPVQRARRQVDSLNRELAERESPGGRR